jgi:hypothetical protein
MVDQLPGAASWAVLVLAYLLLVEAMAAAIVVLAEFTLHRVRSLRGLLTAEPPRPVPAPAVVEDDQGQGQPYRLGGGLMRWH